ncbi:hypothetical protein CIT292_06423 [Citrobacter youngae ATCC 29220]|uniref:Uncharacterized protein n=1 Tax=Citrobacter youngae ATCC 29220 TaxID=500640 RepID=D4B819_9ENTR|nr:hypothetical protein CIT292_06423 [Citrobacter youngae ATCC 29220]
MPRQIVNVVESERMAIAIKKTTQREHATVIRALAFQTIEYTVIAIVTRRPAGFQRTIPTNPMTARLRFTKGQDNVQMMFPALYIPRREPKIITVKVVQIRFWRQQQS